MIGKAPTTRQGLMYPQITQRGLRAATKTMDRLDPQITQIGRFQGEPRNLFRKTRFCELV